MRVVLLNAGYLFTLLILFPLYNTIGQVNITSFIMQC
ncbi:hypothetical protein DK880_00511 [Candidatus Cardinium hertigii]|uniref:Uncharacterized protein n=1 Tax=Candidatus Cardinium hertigii TaxID=247481 RepID=A0A2Z3LCD1_9BACT|nr:hypothetical protein DK880_00511 [Candidatus Cardinium hertigii]